MRILSILVFLLFSNSVFTQDYFENRLFIKIKDEQRSVYSLVNDVRFEKILPRALVKSLLPVSKHPLLSSTYELILNESYALDSLVAKIRQLEQIEYAEKVPLYKLFFTPNDPLYSTQWNLAKIQADLAWNLGQGCTQVKIAVTDDGFLMNHEDLVNQWHINTGEINGNGIDDDGNGYIDDWRGWDAANNDNDPSATAPTNSFFTHGTHVAGIVAAQTHNNKGIAAIGYNCKMIPVKIGLSPSSSLTGAFQGLDYAINASGCDVINMSWGGGAWSATFQTLFNIAKSKGIICVAAAGNSNTSTPMYPASYNHVISVAASGSTDARASFSNFGSTIDVTAPGVGIPSCLAGSITSYGNLSGTSMASPLVAGLCGLMKCYNPMPADSIEACLKRTCDNINAQNPTFIGQLGAGRVNAFQALQCLTKKPKSDFIALDTFQCPTKAVRYQAKSFGIPTLTYSWSFPGGSPATSTSANPIVTYATAGYKSATLITCNSLGCDTMTKTNYVNIDTPKAWLNNRVYTTINAMNVVIAVHFKGRSPFSVTLTDGSNTWTQTNIQSNPYLFSIQPKKDTSILSISSFSDSSCAGNKYGQDTIYRKLLTKDTTICVTLKTSQSGALDGFGLSPTSSTNITWTFANNENVVANWTAGGSPHFWRCILKFNLSNIPANAVINSASLSLYSKPNASHGWSGQPTAGTDNSTSISRITNSWTTTSIATNAWPSTTVQNQVTLAQSPTTNHSYTNVNVKNLIQDLINNGDNGIFLRHVNTPFYNSLIFYSAEETDTSKHPKLVLCYTIPAGSSGGGGSSAICESSFQFNGTPTNTVVKIDAKNGAAWKDLYSTNGFTWECWFNLGNRSSSSVTGIESLVGATDAQLCEDIGFHFNWPWAGSGKFNWVVSGQTNCSVPRGVIGTNMTFNANTWYHAAGVMNYSTNTMQLYINGNLVNSGTLTIPMSQRMQNSVAVTIGNQDVNYNPYHTFTPFNGKIDEVRFWNTVRTASEIQANYKQCLAANTPNLVAYFKADEGSGTNTVSKINGNFVGTLQNGATWSTQVDSVKNCNLCNTSDCDTSQLNTGKVLHLDFNGNTQDKSGNGLHGTTNNVTLTTDRKGNSNSAYLFNGTNSYIEIPFSNLYQFKPADSFSISLWCKPSSNSNIGGMFVKSPFHSNYVSSQWNYGMYCLNNKVMSGWANNNFLYSKTNLTVNQNWHHVVVTYKNGIWKMYINCKLDTFDNSQTKFIISDNSSKIAIGRKGESSGDYFQGSIDEVRLYNRVLTDNEVKVLGDCCSTAPSDCDTSQLNTGKVLHLDFNGNTQDKSGNNNHATNFGATPVAGKDGVANTAYRFNGTSNYMQIANSSSLNNFSGNKITLTAILKPRGFYNGTCKGNSIIMKGNSDYVHGNYLLRYSPNNGCNASADTNENNFYGAFSSAGGCSLSAIHNPPYVKRDTWYCLVSVYTGDSIITYINGIRKYSCQYSGGIGSHNLDVFIGKLDNATYPYWLNADVDDIRIYNRVLAPAEVKGYCGTCNVQPPQINCNSWLKTVNIGDKVTVGDLDVSGDKLTVEAWVNRENRHTGVDNFSGDIVSKHTGPTNSNYNLRIQQAEITTSNNGYVVTPSFCSYDTNKTYHVAMVYDGANLKFYRNGYLMTSVAASGNLITNNLNTTIADYAGVTTGQPENMNGYINEVRIWNIARTQTQLRMYMSDTLPNPTSQTGLLGYYRFDNLLNKQGNTAYNGTLGGNAQINQINPNCNLVIDSCGIIIPPQTDCDTSGLVLCMSMDGTTIDSSKYNNHGTKIGGVSNTNDRFGNTNSAYSFNGTNAYIEVPSATSIQLTNDLTISLWINQATTSTLGYRLVDKITATTGDGYLFDTYGHPTNTTFRGRTTRFINKEVNWHSNNKPFNLNTWVHVVVTHKNGLVSYYTNGILDTSYTHSITTLNVNTLPLRIGAGNPLNFYFNGAMDNLKIYRRALTALEVFSLYSKPFTCNCTSTQPPIICDTSRRFTYTQCLNDSLQVTLRAGSQYQWSPKLGLSSDTVRNPKIYVTANQRYLVSYMGTKGCQVIDTIDISVRPSAIYPKMEDQLICIGDSVQMTIPIYATNVQWSPNTNISSITANNPFFYPTVNTTYYLQFRDTFGCVHKDTFVVNTKVCCPARARFSIPKELLCFGEDLSITNRSKGPITGYNWNFSNANPNSFAGANPPVLKFPAGGTYPLRLIVTNGICFDTMTKIVTVVQVFPNAGKDTTNCLGAFVTDLGESPISDWTYKWTPTIYLDDPNIANPKCSIVNDSVNYVVEVTDRNSGCKAYDTVVVYTNRSIDSTAQNLRICNGDSVLFNGIQRKTTGNYYFTIKKADGFCDSFINILRLNVLQKQVIPLDTLRKCEQYIDSKGKKHTQSFIENDTIKSKSILNCDSMVYIRHVYIYKKVYRDRPSVSGCAPFRYNGKTYTDSKMRVDSLVIRNIYLPSCDTIEYINVIVFPKPKAVITPSIPNPVLYKQTVTLSASGGQRYFWLQTGSTNQDVDYKINNTQPKLFTVRVTDENECWDTVSYLVKGILPDTCYYGFPNVFSPNQDNLNDEYIPNMDECTDVIVFAIYDRWGEKVFETNQLKGWNGYFKGRPAPMGVYLYYAEFNTPWGIRKHKGTFTLMR